MAQGGTKIYCPGCKEFSICRAVSPTSIGKPKSQRWKRTDHQDICWFRRARKCQVCGALFLTSEVEESFISELVELRKRLAEKNKGIARKIRRRSSWLKREETIPLEIAERFVRASVWWLTHSSGSPVRAPKHANRIYKSGQGWAIDFGSNTFLVGIAIQRCKAVLSSYLESASEGVIPLRRDIEASLARQISGAVATSEGYEYSGYYPITGSDLVFGATSIDLNDATKYLIQETGIDELLLEDGG